MLHHVIFAQPRQVWLMAAQSCNTQPTFPCSSNLEHDVVVGFLAWKGQVQMCFRTWGNIWRLNMGVVRGPAAQAQRRRWGLEQC